MKTSNKQVTIIGAGLGGLSAAIYLRLAGYEVRILEANERVGGRANLILRDGFRFDTGPSLLNYPWVFEDLFRAAGRDFYDYVELLAVDPAIKFQWANGTHFTLSSQLPRLLEECERLEPGSRPALLSFMQDASAKYRIAFDRLISSNVDNPLKWLAALSPAELLRAGIWRSLDSELGRFFQNHHIREALGSYAMYLGGSPFNLPGMFSILPYGELAYGLWLPRGGVYGLVEGMEKLALELGVEIQTGQRVKRIASKDGQVTGVELAEGRFHPASLVVSNVDLPTTQASLLTGIKAHGRAGSPRMTPGVITFYWGIRGEVENLGHHTIFLPDDYRAAFTDLFTNKRISVDPPFYVSVPSATDTSLAPPGDSVVFVLVPTPLLSEMPEADWQLEARKVREKVLNRLSRHGIEIDPRKIVVEEVLTPVDWRNRFGLYDGSAFGAAHTLFQIGPFRTRNYSREMRGLYYVGASTTPGTGMPMVVLGGKRTAERILSHAR